jgi:poly(3-hydroxybutyrate) depolymerase
VFTAVTLLAAAQLTGCRCASENEPGAGAKAEKAAGKAGKVTETKRAITVGSGARDFLVRTPTDGATKRPILIYLTGSGETPDRFGLRKDVFGGAQKLGYVLAVPTARGSWQHGGCTVSPKAKSAKGAPTGSAAASSSAPGPKTAAPAAALSAKATPALGAKPLASGKASASAAPSAASSAAAPASSLGLPRVLVPRALASAAPLAPSGSAKAAKTAPQKPSAKPLVSAVASAAPSAAASGQPAEASNDDSQFLKALIADLASREGGDPSRVFVIGFDEGARMALRFAADVPGAVTAIAAVAGPGGCVSPSGAEYDVLPASLVPTLLVFGTRDPQIELAPPDSTEGSRWLAAQEVLEHWLTTYNCNAAPKHEDLGSKVMLSQYSCPNGGVMATVLAPNTRHEFPRALGKKHAMREIHEFFETHSKHGAP